jgi:hypothetical protein
MLKKKRKQEPVTAAYKEKNAGMQLIGMKLHIYKYFFRI